MISRKGEMEMEMDMEFEFGIDSNILGGWIYTGSNRDRRDWMLSLSSRLLMDTYKRFLYHPCIEGTRLRPMKSAFIPRRLLMFNTNILE